MRMTTCECCLNLNFFSPSPQTDCRTSNLVMLLFGIKAEAHACILNVLTCSMYGVFPSTHPTPLKTLNLVIVCFVLFSEVL